VRPLRSLERFIRNEPDRILRGLLDPIKTREDADVAAAVREDVVPQSAIATATVEDAEDAEVAVPSELPVEEEAEASARAITFNS
jgi:hypothetical protein